MEDSEGQFQPVDQRHERLGGRLGALSDESAFRYGVSLKGLCGLMIYRLLAVALEFRNAHGTMTWFERTERTLFC